MFLDSQTAPYTTIELGFNQSLIRSGVLTGLQEPPSMTNNFSNGVTTNMLGGQELGGLSGIGYQLISVVPGQDIQVAIDKVAAAGGGCVRLGGFTYYMPIDINIPSKVILEGQGRDQTILEFSSAAKGVKMVGTAGSIIKFAVVKNLTIQNSNNSAGLTINFADYFTLDNVRVTSCDQKGISIDNSQQWKLINCSSDDNVDDGYFFGTGATRTNGIASVTLCYAEANGGENFSCGGDQTTFTSCIAFDADLNGFLIQSTCGICTFIGCISEGNGFVSGQNFEIEAGAGDIIIIGNPTGSVINTNGTNAFVFGNHTFGEKSVNEVSGMENQSGSTINAGEVVILSAHSSARRVERTTTVGHDLVWGVAQETAANTSSIDIITRGFVTNLKVNGTTDIAVGDLLSTYSVAGIAAKASAGDMCFAIALEAYTANDSSGVIDALIIYPRLI
jgi:hypothetical protein